MLACLSAACGDEPQSASPPSTGPARNSRIQSLAPMHTNGARSRFAPDGQSFVFDRANADGFYDVYVSNLSGQVTLNVTEGRAGVTQRHNGNSIFHPGGRFILFVSEEPQHFGVELTALGDPGIGLFSNFWAFDRDTQRVTRLTNIPIKRALSDPTVAMAVVNPVFSADGNTFVWTERYDDGGNLNWGRWRLKTARFVVDGGGVPALQGERVLFTPSRGNYVTAMDFLDAGRLLVAGNLDGQHEFGMDQYVLDVATLSARNLTNTPQIWDEGSCVAPNGQIVFMSNRDSRVQLNFSDADWPTQPVERDYYLINQDGGGLERLTYFNEPGAPEATGRRTIVAVCDFSPDGSRMGGTLGLDQSNGPRSDMQLRIELFGFRTPLRSVAPVDLRELIIDESAALGGPGDSSDRSVPPVDGEATWIAAAGSAVEEWRTLVDSMIADGRLQLVRVVGDTLAPDREHEYYEQQHAGVTVLGAYVRREVERRRVLAIHGRLFERISVDAGSSMDAAAAGAAALGHAGSTAFHEHEPRPAVLPSAGRFRPVYCSTVRTAWDVRDVCVDSGSGEVVVDRSGLRGPWQSHGSSGLAVARRFRPAAGLPLILDFRGDVSRFGAYFATARAYSADAARADDAVASGIAAELALLHDYLRDRFLRNGIDGEGKALTVVLRPATGDDASAAQPALAGQAVYLGEGALAIDPRAAGMSGLLARGVAHATLDQTSRLVNSGSSAGLADGFGDIVAAGAEQYALSRLPAGAGSGALSYIAEPTSSGRADHVSRVSGARRADDEASIASYVFALAARGGTHKVSGVRVEGVGQIEPVERVFYRAYAYFLGPVGDLGQLRRATLTAATELYGAASAVRRQLELAWTAVGVL